MTTTDLRVPALIEAIRAEISAQGATVAVVAVVAGMAPIKLEQLLHGTEMMTFSAVARHH